MKFRSRFLIKTKTLFLQSEFSTIGFLLVFTYMNILFYNVENLFDTLDNPFFEDGAFLPDSGLKWNEKRYILKLQRIAKVIQAVEGPSPMAIGFAEVENRKVLQDLVAAMGRSVVESRPAAGHTRRSRHRRADRARLRRPTHRTAAHRTPGRSAIQQLTRPIPPYE